MSNLYVGRKCIGASWKPLKIEPGGKKQHIRRVRINRTQQPTAVKTFLYVKVFTGIYMEAYHLSFPWRAGRAPTEGPFRRFLCGS